MSKKNIARRKSQITHADNTKHIVKKTPSIKHTEYSEKSVTPLVKPEVCDLYEQIISINNIREAYLEIVKSFEESSKSGRYTGIDGIKLNELDIVSEKLFADLSDELKTLKPIIPVISQNIPKKSGGKRQIFIYSLSDRIKAQAIARVVEPFFETAYSPFLFSYRKTHPSYYASKSAVSRYKRKYGQDFVVLFDLKQYSEYIDYKLLEQKLIELKIPEKVLELLRLYIYVDKCSIISRKQEFGLIQGVPLIAFFANLYLTQLDKTIGPKVQFYRRVGDDIIVCDPDEKKLHNVYNEIISIINDHKLVINNTKSRIFKNTEPLNYLGYHLENRKIAISDKTINRLLAKWKSVFKYSDTPISNKIRKIRYYYYKSDHNLKNEFEQLLKLFPLIDNFESIKHISYLFDKMFTKYLYRYFSAKNMKKTKSILKELGLASFLEIYVEKIDAFAVKKA